MWKISNKALQGCLSDAQKELGIKSLKYDTASKVYRFQFDVPKDKASKIPDSYTNTSNSKNTKRYQNEALRKIVEELIEAEDSLKNALSPFLRKVFRKFYKKQHLWSVFLACLAEVDCLMSLADVSKNEKYMVKPEIIESGEEQRPTIEIKAVRHP